MRQNPMILFQLFVFIDVGTKKLFCINHKMKYIYLNNMAQSFQIPLELYIIQWPITKMF